MVSFKVSFIFCLFYLDGYGVVQGSFCLFYLYSYGVVQGIFYFLLVLPLQLWCRSWDLLFFVCFTFIVMVSFNGAFVFCLFYLYGYGVVQGSFCFLFVLSLQLWCRSRDLLFFVCFTFIVMVSFMGSFVVCLFYLYGYGVVQWIFCFCLFYLYSYGVVQGSFCFLFVLSLQLWCRSRDLLFFACFTLMVMVSFKGAFVFVCFIFIVMVSFKRSFIFCLFYLYSYVSFNGTFVFCLFYLYSYGVVHGIFCFLLVLSLQLWCRSKDLFFCLFYLYSYGVVQAIFYFLLVLPLQLWCRSMELLFFVFFIFIVMVSFMGSFVFCLFYLYMYGVVQRIFCFCLFYLYSYGVVQAIFYFLFVLPLQLWCRSMELLFFACFIFIVMVSFKGAFVFCLFYLDSYGVVQAIFYFLFVLPLQLWCRSMELLFFACFIFIVMVSFMGSFVFCLFYLYSYGVVQRIFCFLFVLSLQLWCRSSDLLFFACFTFIVMVSFNGTFVFCLFYLYSYGVVQWIFCFCLFYLYSYGVVQGGFCFLLVLP